MDRSIINSLRLERQRLLVQANEDDYDELFRAMSPVHTLYWTEPGAPPLLMRRASFDDLSYNQARRAGRKILKGRYQNGSVGYVDERDLELYACAYRKGIPSLGFEDLAICDLLLKEGPMTINDIKRATGLFAKYIKPALLKLQQAFLVFEDQIDNDWDRAWYAFESEFPDVDPDRYGRTEAIEIIIKRFASLSVAACAESVKSFYGFNSAETGAAIKALAESGEISFLGDDGFFCLREDEEIVNGGGAAALPKKVFLLHRSDFWVKSEEYLLKKRFAYGRRKRGDAEAADGDGGAPSDVLYYVVIDGEISGAVLGRFKFGPHLVEDVVVAEGARCDRDEILEAVCEIFDKESSPAKRFNGMIIN